MRRLTPSSVTSGQSGGAEVESLAKDGWQTVGVEVMRGKELAFVGIDVGTGDHDAQDEMEMGEGMADFASHLPVGIGGRCGRAGCPRGGRGGG
ncbi:hypothetical protein M3484_04650, partial [Pseudomonas sp. GX19020]|uniref:hypothetical protein n=1 Tax=Pseudomonas sp. GX19020 TaxID=2942277 RepID=UPI0020187375